MKKDKNKKNKLNKSPEIYTNISNDIAEDKTFFEKIAHGLSKRNNILAIVFAALGIAIFINTAILQFEPESNFLAESLTKGSSREITVKASRGNIYDKYGVPLAINEKINVLYLCEAGLENSKFNAMLLDLALFLESEDVSYIDPLADYISIDPINFKMDIEDIVFWQKNSNTFGLKENNFPEKVHYSDKKFVKTDPIQFFDYIRYTIFDLDESYSVQESYKIMRLRYAVYLNRWAFSNGTPIQIAKRVPDSTLFVLEEQNYRFTGILSASESERVYLPDAKYLSHIIGYMGLISSGEYDELKNAGYSNSDKIGKSGVEKYAERYLHGTDGKIPYNILTARGENEIYFSHSEGKPPVSGNNVMLTVDIQMQKIAYNALEENIKYIKNNPKNKNKGDADSGAVVVLDIKKGQVLAMVSYPSFDPNDFQMAEYDIESQKRMISALTNTKDKPMLNRAIMEIYAPGSTFKPITAVSALQEGTNTVQHCGGTEMIGEWKFRCLEYPRSGHGSLSLTQGMATSCNIYFHKLGVATGIDKIDKWMKHFGLGEYTGIDLPGEEKGYRSNRETKKLLRQNIYDQKWLPADTAQSAIGQFENKYTIIQLAQYVSALATGKRTTPHVIKEISRNDGSLLVGENYKSVDIPVNDSTLKAVKEGMIAVSKDRRGTARSVFSKFPITIACKTGTAETGHEDKSSSNALFISYAPADNPEIAIAQIVEKGVWGSNTMSITRDILTEYFKLNKETEIEVISEISLE